MAIPSTIPVWNSSGLNRTTPASGKQSTGYVAGEDPSSSERNWIDYWTYQWIQWLNDEQGASEFGDASDGDLTLSTQIAATSDLYYGDLTIQNGGELITDGFRIFVRGTLTIENGGLITANGGDAPFGSGADNGSVWGGTDGGAGSLGTANGSNGSAFGASVYRGGGTGGAGGDSGAYTGGAAGVTAAIGTGGSAGPGFRDSRSGILHGRYWLRDGTMIQIGGGTGGGGGAADSGTGGQAGGGAGALIVIARHIVIASGGAITANGGDGGAGTGDGGQGGGGGGGLIILGRRSISNDGTIEAVGGSGANAGSDGQVLHFDL